MADGNIEGFILYRCRRPVRWTSVSGGSLKTGHAPIKREMSVATARPRTKEVLGTGKEPLTTSEQHQGAYERDCDKEQKDSGKQSTGPLLQLCLQTGTKRLLFTAPGRARHGVYDRHLEDLIAVVPPAAQLASWRSQAMGLRGRKLR